MPTAHCVSTLEGVILDADKNFAKLLGRPESEIIGMSYRLITHPDDLVRSADMLSALVDRAPPVRLQKRYVRPDGSFVTANVLVTRLSDPDRLISTLIWNETGRQPPPVRLWEAALLTLRVHDVRRSELGRELFTDHLGLMLIAIYLAEAESRIVSVRQLADLSDMPLSLTVRWLRVLQQRGIVMETNGSDQGIQLTHEGLEKAERILSAAIDPLMLSISADP